VGHFVVIFIIIIIIIIIIHYMKHSCNDVTLPVYVAIKVLKEIAVKDCRNSNVSRPAAMSATSAIPQSMTSPAANCDTADITPTTQRYSPDGDTCSGLRQPDQHP